MEAFAAEHWSECAGENHLLDFLHGPVIIELPAHRQNQIFLSSRLFQLPGFCRVCAQRLFTEDIRSVVKRAQDHPGMQMNGRTDNDQIGGILGIERLHCREYRDLELGNDRVFFLEVRDNIDDADQCRIIAACGQFGEIPLTEAPDRDKKNAKFVFWHERNPLGYYISPDGLI